MTGRADSFPSEVAQELQVCVYRLIDPRNGETFYVGRGRGNRVFAHIRAEASVDEQEPTHKIRRIREIRGAGFEVAHVIHRHGMDKETACEVKAALIDAYPGLTNLVAGAGADDFGVMHADEIIERYAAEEATFEHQALLISVNKSVAETSLYEATRYAWRINPEKADQADVILSTVQGLIRGAFVADASSPGRGPRGCRHLRHPRRRGGVVPGPRPEPVANRTVEASSRV